MFRMISSTSRPCNNEYVVVLLSLLKQHCMKILVSAKQRSLATNLTYVSLLQANSAFHPSGVGKQQPALADKSNAK